MVTATAVTTGSDYFYALVQSLAQTLRLRYCFVTECLDSPPSRVATLAFWAQDSFLDNFEYSLVDTPCARVVAEDISCFYADDIQSRFARDQDLVDLGAESYAAVPFLSSEGSVIGHLAVLDVEPLNGETFDLSVLELFASRAGAELERMRVLNQLEENQRTLRESEARLRQVIDLVPHFIFAKDRDGRFNLANQAVANAYGTTVDRLLGRTDAEFASSEEEAKSFRADDLEVIKSGRAKVIPEEQVTDSEGRVRHLQTTKIPFTRADSELPSVLGVSVDITELKQAEEERRKLDEQMRRAQKLESLGVLAGGIAHDFNNLLVGILGNANFALRELPADAPSRKSIESLELAAERAAELCNQMLAYSGRGKFVVEPIDLGALVRDMLDLLQASISKKATLELDLQAELPAIEADVTEVRQIVMNLLTNASEALGDGEGKISISTGVTEIDRSRPVRGFLDERLDEGSYIVLQVADTGCGMSDETLERIFDPFFSTKFSGRGLGLAAVLGIVRGHGGSLEVSSVEGRSSRFTVLLPASQAQAVPLVSATGPAEIEGGGRTLMVVDDDESVLDVVTHILEDSGFRVITATNGQAALDRLSDPEHEISGILLDITMPQLDGIETLQAIRQLQAALPVVLTSGYSEQEISRRLGDSPRTLFIQKPFAPDDLIARLTEALSSSPSHSYGKIAPSRDDDR
ncbi:MAG: response regulator [Acidobacteriota bacterium]